MSGRPRVLVIGYGNPGRCDDGLGPALADELERAQLPGVHVESSYQLNVEDAARVADFDVTVFVDASLCGPAPYFVREVEPWIGTPEFTTHSLSPEGVLGLAHRLYGARTRGWALGVRGYEFGDFAEGLTGEALGNLAAAVRYLSEAVAPGGALAGGPS